MEQKSYLQTLQDTMQPMTDMLSYYELRIKFIEK